MFLRFTGLLCVFALLCTLFTACGEPSTKDEILAKLPYKIDYAVTREKAAKIKNAEYSVPKDAAPVKIESVSLVADRSGSMGRFLGSSLTTYTNVLSALSDVFSGVSLTCNEIPNMNTGGELRIEAFPAARIEDWRSPDSYTYDGGTDLYAMIKLVIEDMNAKSHDGSLYVIISDITPQPVLGSDNILSSEYQMNEIGKLLVENVILKPGLSVGIVGIQADRAGNLSGLPDKSQRGAGGLQTNPFVVKQEDILSEGGTYKSPLYLLLLGDERVVQDSVNKLNDKITERIRPAEGELKSYIVPRIEVRAQEKFDDSREDQKITLPSVKLAGDFAQYAAGAAEGTYTEPLSVYQKETYDPPRYLEDGRIPFYRLYDAKRSGPNADIVIEADIPYILALSPENKEIPITADFLDMDAAKSDVKHYAGKSASGEPLDGKDLQTGDMIERKSLEFVKGTNTSGNAAWRWTLALKPEALRLDEPVLFVTETKIPLKGEKVHELVSQAISGDAEWLFDDVSEKSWSLDIPKYWAYRESGGQYTQAHQTPYMSTLFRTVRNEIANSVASDLHKQSEDYSRLAMFGFVVRGSANSYYPGNNKDRSGDPYHIALPKDKIDELDRMASE